MVVASPDAFGLTGFGLTVRSAPGKTGRYLRLALTPGAPSNRGFALYELAFSET